SMEIFKAEGMLAPYSPVGFSTLNPRFSDSARPPSWVGQDVFAAVVCYNTVEGQKKGIPKPETWADLTKPIYKGQVVMPNPASSGTGYLSVVSILQRLGEQKGWEYLDALHKNIAEYTKSDSKLCKDEEAGERAIVVTFV